MSASNGRSPQETQRELAKALERAKNTATTNGQTGRRS